MFGVRCWIKQKWDEFIVDLKASVLAEIEYESRWKPFYFSFRSVVVAQSWTILSKSSLYTRHKKSENTNTKHKVNKGNVYAMSSTFNKKQEELKELWSFFHLDGTLFGVDFSKEFSHLFFSKTIKLMNWSWCNLNWIFYCLEHE